MKEGDYESGGKDYKIREKPAEMRYEINEASKPFTVDIFTIDVETKKEYGRLLGIFELPDKKLWDWRFN